VISPTNIKLKKSYFILKKCNRSAHWVGGVAHEFNNTLAGITGRLFLAKESAENNPETLQHIEKISLLTSNAATIVQQLLAFSRKSPVKMTNFSLTAFIKETIKLHRLSVPENIKLSTDISANTLPIQGDATQLQQILVNLLHNARDAVVGVNEPHINITLSEFKADASFMALHPNLKETNYAKLTVEDNGCGIPEKEKECIFDPFFTTKEVGKGTGLGLSMVYGSIQTHEGTIEVSSSLGKGTQMQIYIPLAQHIRIAEPKQNTQLISGRGESILYVDDEDWLRETGKEVLEALGYSVLEASNGREAVEMYMANQDSIGLIIMDVVMPNMGGVEAAEEILAHNSDVKIIYCTGYDREDMLRGENLEHATVLTKPYKVHELSQLLGAIFPT